MGTVWGTLISGILFTWFGNTIGMSQFHWGVLGAVGAWVVLLQPVSALLGARLGSRKLVWYWFALGERVVRLAALAGAWLAWRAGLPSAWVILVALVSLSGAAGSMSSPVWWGWLATLIPREIQGSFWGRRDTWTSIAVAAVILPTTFLIDQIPAGAKPVAVFSVLMATSVIGILDILLHAAIPEPPMPVSDRSGSMARVLKPLRDRRFRPWLVFIVAWNLSMSLGGSLCMLYFMENLGLKDNLLGGAVALNVVSTAGQHPERPPHGADGGPVGQPPRAADRPPGLVAASRDLAVRDPAHRGDLDRPAGHRERHLRDRGQQRRPEAGDPFSPARGEPDVRRGVQRDRQHRRRPGALAAGAFLQLMGDWTAPVGRLVLSPFPLLFLLSFVLRLSTTLALVPRIREQGVRDDERPMLLPLFFGLPVKRRKG